MKYGLIGPTGRLGKEIIEVFNSREHELVFAYDIDGEWKNSKPDILIDCSLPEVFSTTIKYAREFNVPLIIATTGLSENNIQKLKDESKRIAIVQSYNFSVGIQVLLRLTDDANKILNGWDIEVAETHHRFKKDKPSGTAKMILDKLGGKKINTSSLRLGNVPGDHSVIFGGLGETLEIKHRALSRRTFAEGILLSADFAINKKNGFYSFTDVVFGE